MNECTDHLVAFDHSMVDLRCAIQTIAKYVHDTMMFGGREDLIVIVWSLHLLVDYQFH